MALSWYLVKAERNKPDNRCRKWRVVVRKDGGGTRSETFHGTKTDARKWAPSFAARVEEEEKAKRPDGLPSETLGAFAAAWNDARLAAGEIGERSWANYRSAVRAYEAVCALPIGEVREEDVNAETARLLASRSPGTARLYRMLLGRVMEEAASRGLADGNAVKRSASPSAPKAERSVLPPDKVAEVLSWGFEDHRRFVVSLVLRTGMRRGEALGVLWGDFDGSAIHVRREVTKTQSGVRDIPLDPDTAQYVAGRRAYLERVNGDVPDGAAMACNDVLEPTGPRACSRAWAALRKELGCEGVRLHDLRHTFITNLAQAGAHPSVMQRLAGHSSPTMALEVYTHVNALDMAQAVRDMADARRSAKIGAKRDGAPDMGRAV